MPNLRNETEIVCWLYSNIGAMKTTFKKIIKEMYDIDVSETNIIYSGVEWNIPERSRGYHNHTNKRVDIMYEIGNVFIPLEVKKEANLQALYQIQKYVELIEDWYDKECIYGVVANHVSKKCKKEIERTRDAFWIELETMTFGCGIGED